MKITNKIYETNSSHKNDEGELSIFEVGKIIWGGKWIIAIITTLFFCGSVIYSISLPNIYKSDLILAPAKEGSSNNLSSLASQYSGIAAITGINIGGNNSNRVTQAVEFMKSWAFLEGFIDEYDLKSTIMGTVGWNKSNNKLIYNEDLYDPALNTWKTDGAESLEPTSFQTYKKLSSMIIISNDIKTGMLTISVEHYSPLIAFEWVNLLKQKINTFYQQQDITEAKTNIDYLKAKIKETNVNEMRSVFYNMIESQTKTLMLAEVSDQYLIKTVVPAKISEVKSKPKRSLICLFGGIIGMFISVIFIFISRLYAQR